jgi:hypothetical protein
MNTELDTTCRKNLVGALYTKGEKYKRGKKNHKKRENKGGLGKLNSPEAPRPIVLQSI